MDHRSIVRPPWGVAVLALYVGLLCGACAAPSTAMVSPTRVPVIATASSTSFSGTATTTPQPSTPTAAQPSTVPTPTTKPTLTSTVTPVASASPISLQEIQPLQQTAVVDRPMLEIRAVTDGTRPYRIAAWSPRGMFAAATPQDGPGVDLIDLSTGLVTPLVTDTYVLEPRWTVDGTLIIHRAAAGGDTITTFDPQTGLDSVPLVTSAPLNAPDVKGDTLVFSRNDEVVVCTAPCTTEARTLPGGALMTALAPGASRMLAWNPLVERLEDVQTSIVSLATERTMAQVVSLPGEGLWLPRWSPDATRLVLTNIEGRLVVVDIATGGRVDLGPGDAPAWSPDGTMLAYAGASAGLEWTTRNIHVVRTDGTEERQRLTDANDEQFYVSPSWSPDGQQILFVELDSGQLFVGTVPER